MGETRETPMSQRKDLKLMADPTKSIAPCRARSFRVFFKGAVIRSAIARRVWPTLVISTTLLSLTAAGVGLRRSNYYDAFIVSTGLFGDKRFLLGNVESHSGRFTLEISFNHLKNADSLPGYWPLYSVVHTGPSLPANMEQWDWGFSHSRDDVSFLGCKFYQTDVNSIMEHGAIDMETTYGVSIPWIEVAIASFIPACIWLARIARRRRRLRRGKCLHCGYDLRASPGVCPECGNIR